jgi:hypothetical protein
VDTLMGVLRGLESYINVDVANMFSTGLHRQMQLDETGQTAAAHFVEFYRVVATAHLTAAGGSVYAPARRAFVNGGGACPLRLEEYTDPTELRALAVLLGPRGVQQLVAELDRPLAVHVGEMKKLLIANRGPLDRIRRFTTADALAAEARGSIAGERGWIFFISFFFFSSSPAQGSHYCHTHALGMEEFLARAVHAGKLLALRGLIYEALREMLSTRAPFIYGVIHALHTYTTHVEELDTLAAHAGMPSDIEPLLVQVVAAHCGAAPVSVGVLFLV